MASSKDQLIEILNRSGLIPPETLDRALAELMRRDDVDSDKLRAGQLAELLVNAQLVTPWQAEQMLQGRYKGFFLRQYKLLGLIATGGMARVYLAEQPEMHRRVAIKVLPRKRMEQESCLERFQREAQAAASLDHPNIVQTFDIDTLDDTHYIVMEYIDGPDVQRIVDEQGPMVFRAVADAIRQAAEAIGYVHQTGMVHRDVKPANLLIDASGRVKLLDMGLARFHEDARDSLTLSHNDGVLGTADYLAPEQAIDSHAVDARADIYGLGCTMYFMLTGRPPFPDGTLARRIMMHQRTVPPLIRAKRPDMPDDLEKLCIKMLAKEPNHRPRTAYEVADLLTEWLLRHGHVVAVTDDFAKVRQLRPIEYQKPVVDWESAITPVPEEMPISAGNEDTLLADAFLSELLEMQQPGDSPVTRYALNDSAETPTTGAASIRETNEQAAQEPGMQAVTPHNRGQDQGTTSNSMPSWLWAVLAFSAIAVVLIVAMLLM